MKRLRGGLVFKAHRLLYHSTLGLRVIKKNNAPSSPPVLNSNSEDLVELLWLNYRLIWLNYRLIWFDWIPVSSKCWVCSSNTTPPVLGNWGHSPDYWGRSSSCLMTRWSEYINQLQGYLAHKKLLPPRTYVQGPMVVLGGLTFLMSEVPLFSPRGACVFPGLHIRHFRTEAFRTEALFRTEAFRTEASRLHGQGLALPQSCWSTFLNLTSWILLRGCM